MVRILFEISLPASTLESVAAALGPGAVPEGVVGRLQVVDRSGGCESPAQGGAASWTPCWISLEAPEGREAALASCLPPLKMALVTAARTAGLELFAVPATAQIGEEFHRFRDLLDATRRLA
ncbi:MAG: hypothetical protein AB1578_22870 [Thermodesulfobacteriota bacterium]|jgi:hypothetical protein